MVLDPRLFRVLHGVPEEEKDGVRDLLISAVTETEVVTNMTADVAVVVMPPRPNAAAIPSEGRKVGNDASASKRQRWGIFASAAIPRLGSAPPTAEEKEFIAYKSQL